MESERRRNQEAYAQLKAELEQQYPGQFIVIAQGQLVAVGATLPEALRHAQAAAPQAVHRRQSRGAIPHRGPHWPAQPLLKSLRRWFGKRACWKYQDGNPTVTVRLSSDRDILLQGLSTLLCATARYISSRSRFPTPQTFTIPSSSKNSYTTRYTWR